MLSVVQATTDRHRRDFRELLSEYLSVLVVLIVEEFHPSTPIDIESLIERDLSHLETYSPPDGCLLLAYDGEELAGCAGLRRIGEDVAELKRMYVRPEHRRKGIGRALTLAVADQARRRGYRLLRLESAPFYQAAHALYRSVGFREASAYPESEAPEEVRHRQAFMEWELGDR